MKSQIAFYGIQEANGFELLRLLRREFSLMSRPEALQHREACLKYTVKKSERHLLMDVLREIGAEIEGFHSMLEASLIAGQLADLRMNEGDQFLLYLRNLLEKVAEYVQLHCGATTVARVWESVLLQRPKAAKDVAKVEGKEESFEKLKKVRSLVRLRSLKNQKLRRRVETRLLW